MELPKQHDSAGHIDRALRRIGRRELRSSKALTSAEAPSVLGYTDVNHIGNFVLEPDGRRRPLVYEPSERLAVNVPYSKLEAFPVGEQRGWGVRCTAPIGQGQVVVEVRGRVLSEAEYEALPDTTYVVSFDDKLLQLKRAANDDV